MVHGGDPYILQSHATRRSSGQAKQMDKFSPERVKGQSRRVYCATQSSRRLRVLGLSHQEVETLEYAEPSIEDPIEEFPVEILIPRV